MPVPEYHRQNVDSYRLPENIRVKWPLGVLKEGFVPLPKTLIRTLGKILSGSDALDQFAVLMAVIDQKRPKAPATPTLQYLAFLTDLSPERTQSLLEQLRAIKLIHYADGPGGLSIDTTGLYQAVAEHAFSETDPLHDF